MFQRQFHWPLEEILLHNGKPSQTDFEIDAANISFEPANEDTINTRESKSCAVSSRISVGS